MLGDMEAYAYNESSSYVAVVDETFLFYVYGKYNRRISISLFRDNNANCFDLALFNHSAMKDRIRFFENVSYSIVDRIIALVKSQSK